MIDIIWKPVIGFEGLYEVSNTGLIKSLKYNIPHVMIGGHDQCGYKNVTLRKDNKAYTKRIHRLVAEAFLPNLLNLKEINHKDENKENNNVDNLEWCTREYNIRYGTRTDKTRKIVILEKDGEYIEFNGLEKAVEYVRETRTIAFKQPISNCCLGITKTAYGFKWKYKEKESK